MKNFIRLFARWSDNQRRAVLQDLVLSCSLEQLSRRRPLLATDFTHFLPRVLSLYVFSFLDPRASVGVLSHVKSRASGCHGNASTLGDGSMKTLSEAHYKRCKATLLMLLTPNGRPSPPPETRSRFSSSHNPVTIETAVSLLHLAQWNAGKPGAGEVSGAPAQAECSSALAECGGAPVESSGAPAGCGGAPAECGGAPAE